METLPVYIINGFLDSGKTEFINYTLGAPYFRSDDKTLLIVCEEGEISYDEKILKDADTTLVPLDKEEDFTIKNLTSLEKEAGATRIIIEWNGMWNFKELKLPDNWHIEQQITNIDGSTFPMYYNNMKSLLVEMIRSSDLIIFNRCDDLDEELASYKRNVKAVNQNAEIVFEDKDGEINAIFEDDLPYDLNSDTIKLDDDSYGIWYIDSLDHAERYKNKTIVFKAMVMKPEAFPPKSFVPGRMAMTCCADDMQFLGFACIYEDADKLKEQDWVTVKAQLKMGFHMAYGGVGPVLYARSVKKTTPPENPIIGFN